MKFLNKIDSASQLNTDSSNRFVTDAEKTKLSNIATEATKNDTDTNLKARGNHTGTQLSSTISDFAGSVRATILTGLNTTVNAVVAAGDTVLVAIGKLQKQITDNSSTTQIALDGKVANSRVLTDVPLNAKFTDNNTTYTAGTGLTLTGTAFTPTFGTTTGTLIHGNDSRLSNARTPVAHVHTKANISDFPTSLTAAGGDADTAKHLIGDDTRSVNSDPSEYMSGGSRFASRAGWQTEFKNVSTIGLTGLIIGAYCYLQTHTPWANSSGGYPIQTAYGNGIPCWRVGVSATSWSAWKKVSDGGNASTVDGFTVGVNVPANAKFTDTNTVYTHPSTTGNKHIPTDGLVGQILKNTSSGTATWQDESDTITTINGKTGAITKADIVALGIPAQDTNTNTTYTAGAGLTLTGTVFTPAFGTTAGTVTQGDDSRLSNARTPLAHTHTRSNITDFPTSMTPTAHTHGNISDIGAIGTTANLMIQTTTSGVLTAKTAGTTSEYLRGDGAWVTPPNTNTTYSAMSVVEGTTGTATSSRTVRADYLKQIIQGYIPSSLPANGGNADTVGGFTVGTNVPSNAKFTDTNTVYTHPTSDGNLHVPVTGIINNGNVLKAGATAGSLTWGTDNDTITTINGKTGVITKADIVALGIPASDTNTTYTASTGLTLTGTAFSITDNAIGATQLNVTGNGTTAQYLRSDADGSFTWATPTNTNTTYTEITTAEITTGTATTSRAISGRRAKDIIDTAAKIYVGITAPTNQYPWIDTSL